MLSSRHLPALILALLTPTAAHASVGIALPEPSSLLLLGVGVAGVAVGRRLSRRNTRD